MLPASPETVRAAVMHVPTMSRASLPVILESPVLEVKWSCQKRVKRCRNAAFLVAASVVWIGCIGGGRGSTNTQHVFGICSPPGDCVCFGRDRPLSLLARPYP